LALPAISALALGFGSAQLALAKKPDDADGKASMKEQKSEKHEIRNNDRDDRSDDKPRSGEKKSKKDKSRDDKSGDKPSWHDKQQGKKADQERKEQADAPLFRRLFSSPSIKYLKMQPRGCIFSI
jgi:hypothetical protein